MEPRGTWKSDRGFEIPYYLLSDLPFDDHFLLHSARYERKNAYAPYSNFLVGVAILTGSGEIRAGHNMENAIYDAVHGEGSALAHLKWSDRGEVRRLAVVAAPDESMHLLVPANQLVTCCGKCRQMIWEFCGKNGSVEILFSDPLLSRVWVTTIGALLPAPFGPEDLGFKPSEYFERSARIPR